MPPSLPQHIVALRNPSLHEPAIALAVYRKCLKRLHDPLCSPARSLLPSHRTSLSLSPRTALDKPHNCHNIVRFAVHRPTTVPSENISHEIRASLQMAHIPHPSSFVSQLRLAYHINPWHRMIRNAPLSQAPPLPKSYRLRLPDPVSDATTPAEVRGLTMDSTTGS